MSDFIRAHPRLRIAAGVLRDGGVIAYPTEAVWGLGADPYNAQAVALVLALKRRDPAKGLILIGADEDQFRFLLKGLSVAERAKLRMSWPGANTWLVPHGGYVPPWISGRYSTVAIRVSSHPVVRALCDYFGGPIVSTSANPQSLSPARYAYRARRYFGNSVYYVPGQVDVSARPSVIRDLRTDRIIRA